MKKKEVMVIADFNQDLLYNWNEFCEICDISSDFLNDLIDYEIIHPRQIKDEQWKFDLTELRRVKIALRLQHDLEVNLSGAALVLELLEELKTLREQNKILERHFIKY